MPTVRGVDFDRVLNLRDDLGVSEGEDAGPAIENALSRPGTLIDVPPGTYHIGSRTDVTADRSGIRGLGDDRTDVRFTVPAGFGQYWLYVNRITGLVVENLSVQWEWDRATGLVVIVHDNAYVGDYEIVGPKPQHSNGGIRGMYYDVVDPDGVGILERYVATGPGEYVRRGQNYAAGLQGLLTDESHKGTLHIRDCDLRNWTENGMYCSRPGGGVVTVERCFLKNIDNAAIRLASPGSVLRDTTIVVDPGDAHPNNDWPDGMNNPRGAWLEQIGTGGGGVTVERLDVAYRNPGGMLRALAGIFHVDSTMGGVDVTGSRFYTEVDHDNLHFNVFVNDAVPRAIDPVEVTFTGCSFTGPASSPAILAETPNRVRVVDSCVDMPNGGELQAAMAEGTTRGDCDAPPDEPEPPDDEPEPEPEGPSRRRTAAALLGASSLAGLGSVLVRRLGR